MATNPPAHQPSVRVPGTHREYHGGTPAIRALQEEKGEAAKKVKALTVDVTALTTTIHQVERTFQVLALESHELRSAGTGQAKSYRCARGAFQPDEGSGGLPGPRARTRFTGSRGFSTAYRFAHKTGTILGYTRPKPVTPGYDEAEVHRYV